MKVLNFAHPLTVEHLAAITRQTGQPVEQVLTVKTQLDPARAAAEQGRALVQGIGLSSEEWQTAALLVNPPTLSVLACVVLAELHGRMGYFPPVLRLRPVQDSVPPAFEVAEVVDLQAVRQLAREKR